MEEESGGTLDSSRISKVFLFQCSWHVLGKFCQEEVILPQCSEFCDSEKSMLNSKAVSYHSCSDLPIPSTLQFSPHTGARIDFIKILDLTDPGSTHVLVNGDSAKLNSLQSSILFQVSASSEKPSLSAH